MGDTRADALRSLPEPLTDREGEILTCLAAGLSNQQIALRLHLALRTVKWYNSHIYSKLGVRKRSEAVKRAAALGLLTPPSTTIRPKHNLPPQNTPFVGRQRELAELSHLLTDPNLRLLTILAPGGMGKTRLALEAARMQIGHYPDGVFFVSLAPLSAYTDIITSVAETIGYVFYGDSSPAQQLIDFLQNRATLLVLDNFEQMLDGAPFVADMVRVAPGLRVLTTSRERLNLSGETVYVLRGLDFPDWQTPERIQSYDAVKLFMQTAHRIHPSFTLQADDLMYLARICHLTAGMPLTIELAAGWLDTLSLERIANEIQQSIDILETNLRDVPERHRSVRATFEITWRRLTEEERAVFGRLSVFRGGFTLPAVQAVAGAGARQLRVLAQKALIQAEGSQRFTIHELLRQFGANKLAENGELPAVKGKHAAFFADFMLVRKEAIYSHPQFEALDQIGADYENVRAAWYVIVECQSFDQLPKFLDGLYFFLDLHNRWQEGVELFETTANIVQSLSPSDAIELTLARLWAQLALFYMNTGFSEKAKATAEAALHLLNRHDSPQDRLFAYVYLALISMFRGEAENERLYAEKACELARQLGNQYWEAFCLTNLAHAARMLNDDRATVLRLVREARAIFEGLDNTMGMVLAYDSEVSYAFLADDYEQVTYWATQCLALAKAVDNTFFISASTAYLAIAALLREDYSQAWHWSRQSLRAVWDAGYTHYMPGPMLIIAQLLLHQNRAELAVEIFALIDRYPEYHGHGAFFEFGPDRLYKLRADLEASLGAERFGAAWERGRERDMNVLVIGLLSKDQYI